MRSEHKNMTETIRKTLEEMILRGELRAHDRLASNAELAKLFNVSTLTANRAVVQLVKSGLVYRKHGCGSFIAESPRRIISKKFHIGIADVRYPASSIWDRVVGIHAKTSINFFYDNHCDVQMIDYETVQDIEKFKKASAHLDGLLVSYAFIDKITIENLKTFNGPIVISDVKQAYEIPFHQIILDIKNAVNQAVKLLMQAPPENVFIIYENDSNGISRKDCFAEILLAAGYDADKITYLYPDISNSTHTEASAELARKIIPEINNTFIFSTSDIVSLVLLDIFHEHGLEPHRDFQLLSCDNLEWVNPNRKKLPVLTTIDLVKEYRATKAAELLLECLNKPGKNETISIKIQGELTIRDTAFNQPKGEYNEK